MTILDPRPDSTRWTPKSAWAVRAPAPARSADDLIRLARRDARSLVTGPEAVAGTGRAAFMALELIEGVTFDGSPTPQLVPDGEGGAEVHWLVNRHQVSASFETDGSWSVWVTDAQDRQVYVREGAPGEAVPSNVVAASRRQLERMAQQVVTRVPR